MKMLKIIENRIRTFDNDEAGLEALQTVMIVAIAAVCLITIKMKWKDIKDFFNSNVDSATSWQP